MGEFIKLNGRVNRTTNRRALKISEREESKKIPQVSSTSIKTNTFLLYDSVIKEDETCVVQSKLYWWKFTIFGG